MSGMPDPPIREKDMSGQAWLRWFLELKKRLPELSTYVSGGYGIVVIDNGDMTITIRVKRQSHETDASTSHEITDPADSPADADALRDDLVTNTIPSIESALNALGTKINNILTKLEAAEVLASS